MKMALKQETSRNQEDSISNEETQITLDLPTPQEENQALLSFIQQGHYEGQAGKDAFLKLLSNRDYAKLEFIINQRPNFAEHFNSREGQQIFIEKFKSFCYKDYALSEGLTTRVDQEEIGNLITINPYSNDLFNSYKGKNLLIKAFEEYYFEKDKIEYLLVKHPIFVELFNSTGEDIFYEITSRFNLQRDKGALEYLLYKNAALGKLFNTTHSKSIFINKISYSRDKGTLEYFIEKNPNYVEVFDSSEGHTAFLKSFEEGTCDKKKAAYLLELHPDFIEAFKSENGKAVFLSAFNHYYFDKEKIEYLLDKNPEFQEVFKSKEAKKSFFHYLGKEKGKEKIEYLVSKNKVFIEYIKSPEGEKAFLEMFKNYMFYKDQAEFLSEINPDFINLLKGQESKSLFISSLSNSWYREKIDFLLEKIPTLIELFNSPEAEQAFMDILKESNLNKSKMEYFLEKHPKFSELFNSERAGEVFLNTFQDVYGLSKLEILLEKNPSFIELLMSEKGKVIFSKVIQYSVRHYEHKLLLCLEKNPALINLFKEKDGNTPLIDIIKFEGSSTEMESKFKLFKLILKLDPDMIYTTDQHGNSLIKLALEKVSAKSYGDAPAQYILNIAEHKFFDVMKYLDVKEVLSLLKLNPKLLEAKTPEGESTLEFMIKAGHHDLLKNVIGLYPELITSKNTNGESILEFMIKADHQDLLKEVIRLHPELITSKSASEESILEFMIKAGLHDLLKEVIQLHPELIISKNAEGENTLEFVIKSGNKDLLDVLLSNLNVKVELCENITKYVDFAVGANQDQIAVYLYQVSFSYLIDHDNSYVSPRAFGILKENIELIKSGKLPAFNINYKDSNNLRLIDKAHQVYKFIGTTRAKDAALQLIIELRNLGSVEPVDHIDIDNKIGKIDLSNDRLDGYEPNKINLPKILRKLLAKYPLSETEINQEIEAFKQKDFSGWANTQWGMGKDEWTVTEIIDELSHMRDIDNLWNNAWDFKKVLAIIIHVANTTNDEILENNLVHTLSDLHKCSTGKMLNLLYLVQDKLVADNFDINPEEETSLYQLSFASLQQTFNENSNKIAQCINKWTQELLDKPLSPEMWSPDFLKVLGCLNQSLYNVSGGQKLSSGNYITLQDKLVVKMIVLISSANLPIPDSLSLWKEAYELGVKLCFEDLMERVLNDPENMESLFNEVQGSAKFRFAQFKEVKVEIIKDYYSKMLEKAPLLGGKFLELLQEICTFENEVEDYLVKNISLENIHAELLTGNLSQQDFLNQMLQTILPQDNIIPSNYNMSGTINSFLVGDNIAEENGENVSIHISVAREIGANEA